jgi:hypothetical protein
VSHLDSANFSRCFPEILLLLRQNSFSLGGLAGRSHSPCAFACVMNVAPLGFTTFRSHSLGIDPHALCYVSHGYYPRFTLGQRYSRVLLIVSQDLPGFHCRERTSISLLQFPITGGKLVTTTLIRVVAGRTRSSYLWTNVP